MDLARLLWTRIETIHALTYFDEAPVRRARELGLSGFWSSYFAYRAAPLGAVTAGVVDATFFNFDPDFVRRWVPAVWDTASPGVCIDARRDAAVEALERFRGDDLSTATATIDALRAASDRASFAGRPLFAANRELPLGDNPIGALWQLCTNLREHRGDGHVAALTAAGLDGLEAHVLIVAEQGRSAEDIMQTRGWTAASWSGAAARMIDRGLLGPQGRLTAAGTELREEIEATTDRLAAAPFAPLREIQRSSLVEALTPLAVAIARSKTIRYPNPIGLPDLSE